MQSRRGGGPHPPAVNLRPDQRADVGIGPYVVQERNDTRRTAGVGLVPATGFGRAATRAAPTFGGSGTIAEL